MPMYNLIEYSDNYSMTSGSLWNYYRDKVNNDTNEFAANCTMNNSKITTSKSFEYKIKIIGRTSANNNALDTEVVVTLKYLSNFWRSLDLPLINCKIELDLSWSKDCIISEILNNTEVPANPAANPPIAHVPEGFSTGGKFKINSTKLYVPEVTLSINDNIKFLENIKERFKRTISWNMYRSEVTTQPEKQQF